MDANDPVDASQPKSNHRRAAPYMPLWVADYLAATLTLTLEQRGAYIQILAVTWERHGVPLVDDDAILARVCSVSVRRWREILRPALAPLFDLTSGFWRQNRLEIEWSRAQQKLTKCASAGAKGGASKSAKRLERGLADATADATDSLERNPSGCSSERSTTHNQIKISSTNVEEGASALAMGQGEDFRLTPGIAPGKPAKPRKSSKAPDPNDPAWQALQAFREAAGDQLLGGTTAGAWRAAWEGVGCIDLVEVGKWLASGANEFWAAGASVGELAGNGPEHRRLARLVLDWRRSQPSQEPQRSPAREYPNPTEERRRMEAAANTPEALAAKAEFMAKFGKLWKY